MRNYELMIIFDSSLKEEEIDNEVSKIASIIEGEDGKVVGTERWGVRELAYPIKHKENGYYFVMYFSGNGRIVSEINRVSKINDRVLRHLIVARSDKNKIFA